MTIHHLDALLITWFRKVTPPLARFALFVVFFWFGALKLAGLSPAGPLVEALFYKTIPWMPFETFYFCFALFECLIGILFLIPKATRIALILLAFHMATTVLPLALLPAMTWTAPFVPTLEGQYIIKNILIIALAIGIGTRLEPLKK